MKKVVKILSLMFLGFVLLISCNNKSADTPPQESKIKEVPVKQIPDENAIADAKLDEENLDDEKTKVTFITAKSIKNGFEDAIKGLKRIENKTINETMVFELYKEGGYQEGPEWDFKAVVRIGDYYLPIHLGDDHSIKIQDLVYDDNMQEIIINTGCFTDAGCSDKRMVVRTFKKRPFTLTDFGEYSNVYLTYKDLDGYYSITGYKEKLGAVLDSKELIIISSDYATSQIIIQSYIPYKTGFAKGSFIKKIKVELAG
ncbi:MAG: hypothetical protein NT021_00460 [Sphingobacteriales bacterium]|nr:hypothetical protein [Sphingobacteriales bacterium]